VTEPGQAFSDHISALADQTVKAVDAHIDQKGIRDGEIEFLPSPGQLDFLEGNKTGMQLFQQILRPRIVKVLL
jgi:hypothetical protein